MADSIQTQAKRQKTLPTVMGHSEEGEARPVVKLGDAVPDVEVHLGFPPEKINIKERVGNSKVLLISLPGAFTPT